jgi:hypothetical protein
MEKGECDMSYKERISLLGFMIMFACAWIAVGFIFGFFSGKRYADHRCKEDVVIADTIYIHDVKVDTLTQTIVKTKTKYVKVPMYVYNTDTITDSVIVPLDYETKNYHQDGLYDITITGYDCVIDSAEIYSTEHIRTIEKIVKEYRTQPFDVYLLGGMRYDFTDKAYFGGMEVRINAGRMTLSGDALMTYTNGAYSPVFSGKLGYNLVKIR